MVRDKLQHIYAKLLASVEKRREIAEQFLNIKEKTFLIDSLLEEFSFYDSEVQFYKGLIEDALKEYYKIERLLDAVVDGYSVLHHWGRLMERKITETKRNKFHDVEHLVRFMGKKENKKLSPKGAFC